MKQTVWLITCQSDDISHNQIRQYRLAKDSWKLSHPDVPFPSDRYRPRYSTRPNDAFLRDLDDDLERFKTIGNNDMVTDDEESEEESEDLVLEVPDSDDDGNDGHDGGSS